MKFTKVVSSIPDQVRILRNRGLVINDETLAERVLNNISYYRLSIYMRFFQVTGSDHEFRKGTTFEEVHQLYLFDRELKLIIFDAIETLEVTVRDQLTLHLCPVHGNNWYEQAQHFEDPYFHAELMEHIRSEFNASEEKFIQYYRNNYSDPVLPPSWMLLEILTFGKLSRIFQNLNCNAEKRKICEYFKTYTHIFPSWLHALGYLRNLCAHHSRLVARKLTLTPVLPSKKSNKLVEAEVNNNSLYAYLVIIKYMLNVISSENRFGERLIALTAQYQAIDLKELGFSDDWQNEGLWQK